MGLLCLVAIADGLTLWTGIPFFISFVLAIILAYIPVIGTVIGIYGAMQAWEWSFLASLALFGFPYILFIILFLSLLAYNAIFGRRDGA
jgi:hypothetical protein